MYTHIPLFLLSLFSFPHFLYAYTFNLCRYHPLDSLSSLLPFSSVFLAIDFLVFLLSFHRFSTPHTICTSAASAATQLAAPRGRARTLSLGLPLPPPSLCAPNSTDRTLVPLTWPLRAFSTCFPTRPPAARERTHTRDGRHTGMWMVWGIS